ncbi:ATP-binding cassette domain-containing protein [Actinotalea ferrariae]|uniref:ABC transporter ATP-binding protein n=1 Tax=Actinotalea ferrariae TaxID=1386098 RepID=UPI001C8BDB35|nr:ATP-binding cassette domain-containing protein [Actinotalea ferrariae]MBX9246364.1 ATP-binding cassette domain-containing protein [Actinotalea ferrariae]
MTPMVEITGLRKAFGSTSVLGGVDLTVDRGSVVALLGPNGAGKTTTVHVLATLLRPDAGRVLVDGLDVVRDAVAVRHRIGLTGQYAALDPLLTGAENLRLMARVAHLAPHAARARCAELLELFDLVDARDRLLRTYSGGMRRRLDLAAGLLGRPALMVLDEPTTGLDPRSRNDLWQVIRDVVADGTTVLLTTQYLDEADRLADRIAVLHHGRVIADGTAAALKRQVGEAHVELVLAGGAVERLVTDGSVGDVRRILADVEARGLAVDHWEVRAPTLDDVFLTLTGAPVATDRTLQEAS